PPAHPAVSAGRRPRCAAKFDSGTVNSAAPSVVATTAMPAQPGEPVTSSISSAPTARPAPVPMPPTTWTSARVPTVRRWAGQPTSGPDRDALGGVEPQLVLGGHTEGLVEGVDVADDLVAA